MSSENDPYIGGQAVIEGVMMRGPQHVAVAVRLPSGEIDVHSEPFVSVSRKNRFLRLPVLQCLNITENLLRCQLEYPTHWQSP